MTREATQAGGLFSVRAERDTRYDVVGLGECSLDHLCIVPGPLATTGKTLLAGYRSEPGGQIASALLGCARLGLRTNFLGPVGDDAAADVVLAPLAAAGVDLRDTLRVPGVATRLAVILVEAKSGRRQVFGYRDPQLRFSETQVSEEVIGAARVLLIDATDPDASLRAAKRARECGVPVVLDADGGWTRQEALLSHVDFPVVDRDFAEELGGTGEVLDGLAELLRRGARLAVATLGGEGAVALGPSGVTRREALPIEVVDTTGAGDAFHTGFAWGLLRGLDVASVLDVASAVAALNCRALGAQAGLPDREEVNALLASAKRLGRGE